MDYGMDSGILCTVDNTVLASFSFPFPLRQTSEDSPLLQQRLLAVYKMCWLKLINYVCDLWPIQLWGGYIHEWRSLKGRAGYE